MTAARQEQFTILSINISEKRGEQKKPVNKALLQVDFGIEEMPTAVTGTARFPCWLMKI